MFIGLVAEAESGAGEGVADRSISFRLFGTEHSCANVGVVLVHILRILAARDPSRIPMLAEAVRTRTRNAIAPTPAEINPGRPDLAQAAEFAPGWLVGLNISNRTKMGIIRAAASVFEVKVPDELDVTLPNAT